MSALGCMSESAVGGRTATHPLMQSCTASLTGVVPVWDTSAH